MRYKWLNQKVNSKLIIFFNGWGMDDCVVKHLDYGDYDVLMFFDYNTLNTDFDFNILNNYSEKNLIAWSMGVMIGTYFNTFFKFSLENCTKTAINGTLRPIDEKYGINPKIYDLTIKGFNESGRKKFVSSMFDNETKTIISQSIVFSRDLENQHSELIALKQYKSDENFKYNKILISDNDKIIPTKSQVEFWGTEPNLKGGHCPFFNFTKWSELLC